VSQLHSFYRGRSVFLTGATGLLGGWLVKTLIRDGAHVTVLLRDGSPRNLLTFEGLWDRVTIVRGSLSDYSLLRRVFSEYSVKTVFHLAAQALVNVAKTDPVGTLEANVQGTWHLLEAARQTGVKQTVVASSDKAYGANERLPYTEDLPLRGLYPYEVSKSCADLISQMYGVTYGVPVTVTRCANIFGGGDFHFSRLLPDLIRTALLGEPFVIRSDGKFVRDFLYVKDAAKAYLLLAARMEADPTLYGQAFNFSLGLKLTVLEFVREVLDLMGRSDLEPIVRNEASNEIRDQYVNAGKARAVLGWTPDYTLREGLEETVEWYRAYYAAEPATEEWQPSAAMARRDP
jgi:CDP-glucose 4,6-dehydratase